MRIQSGLTREMSSELAARIQPCRARPDCDSVPAPDNARKLAVKEVSQALGVESRGFTQAIRTLLVRSSESTSDPVPAVLDKLNGALDKAAEALKSAGFSDEQIEKALNGVREQLGASLAASAEQTSAAASVYGRKDKASLSIQTQEGDQIRVRFATRNGFAAGASEAEAGDDRRVYGVASGRVEISVNGELNPEELAAIGELVGKVETLAKDFFAGDIEKAFAAAARLGFDGDQIASFALKLSTREMVRQGDPAAVPAQVPATPPAAARPVKKPVASAPITPIKPSAAPVTKPVTTPATTPATTPVAATPPPAPSPESAPAPAPAPAADSLPLQLASSIGDFFRQMFSMISQPMPSGRFEFSMEWKMQLIVDAVQAAKPPTKPDAGTQLLTTTLTAVGEQLAAADEAQEAKEDPAADTKALPTPALDA